MTDTDIAALVKRLRNKADMIQMGEKIQWGSDGAVMHEAADALEACQAERDYWKERANFIEVLRQELATMQARAEKAEAEIERLREGL